MNHGRFYLLRLRNTSLPELLHRLRESCLIAAATSRADRFDRHLKQRASNRFDAGSLALPGLRTTLSADAANRLLSEKTLALNSTDTEIHRFEERWKSTVFSRIGQTDSVDIRAVWEPARLQDLMALLAYLSSGGREDSGEVRTLLKSSVLRWIADNPFLFGPHYISAMECALRIIVCCYCLKQPVLLPAQRASIAAIVFEQAWLVSKRLSLYSSVGNHTIAESVGLIFAGGMFRNTREGRKWIGTGVRLLDRELHHQVLDDGGPAEQSFNYHRFVLDLYWLAIDFLEMNNLHDCSDWRPRLTLGEAFLASFESGARLPAIGDSDDGYAIAPGVVPNRAHASADRPLRQTFLSSGYTILRTSTDAALVFDHGPLGMPPFHNHGHADALSVILTKENEEILVDPGTYRYNGEPEWRRYFKGTRAHNTVTIDGLDQAVQETSFIWSRPYKTRLARTSEQQGCAIVEALHDGYARLKHPVYHTRTVLLLSGKDFLIKDTFSGEGDHRFEVNFHLHPEAVAVCEGPWFSLQRGPATISVRLLDDDRLKLAGGQESPLLGWYSPAYGVKVESRVLTCAKKGRPGEISFAALICTGDDRPDVGRLAEMACQA